MDFLYYLFNLILQFIILLYSMKDGPSRGIINYFGVLLKA